MSNNKTEKKLYVCSLNVGMMVWASSLDEARELAVDHLDEEVGNCFFSGSDFCITPAFTGRHRVLAEHWSLVDRPYGVNEDDGDPTTVEDCFEQEEKGAWKK